MSDTVKLTADEVAKLKAEASAPLTPLEQEQFRANLKAAPNDRFVKEMVDTILATRSRWCTQALLAQVEKGAIPKGLLEGNAENARGWLKERGYRWALDPNNPLWMAFYRGETKVAELNIKLSGLRYAPEK